MKAVGGGRGSTPPQGGGWDLKGGLAPSLGGMDCFPRAYSRYNAAGGRSNAPRNAVSLLLQTVVTLARCVQCPATLESPRVQFQSQLPGGQNP